MNFLAGPHVPNGSEAFQQGYKGGGGNPHAPGTVECADWEAGRVLAEDMRVW